MGVLDPEDQQGRLENLGEMDCLGFQGPLDPRGMPVMEQSERKGSQGSQGQRVVLGVLGSPVLASLVHQDSVELMEILVFLVCQDHLVYLDREDKCCPAPSLESLETPVTPVYQEDQVLKVSPVYQAVPDVPGLMEPKERGETLVLEANLDHKVFLDPEEILDFQVPQGSPLMGPGGRMEFLGGLEPKVSPEMFLEPHQEVQDETVCQGSLGTRASPGPLEDLDYQALMDVSGSLD